MNKWSITGGILCIAGLVLYGFQSLSSLMERQDEWDNLCIFDMVAAEKLTWIDKLTLFGLKDLIDYLGTAPLYIELLVVGAILLIISGFVKT